ncbi:MAG: pyridoxal-phosphate dependent enzyme [Negativicutes bacterium]|nr:pyridoxal-phosphate dependent enzyme [Negativicutes bacterium]
MTDQVLAAARILAGVTHRTPVIGSRLINELTGGQVFFKCENFQRGGAFKLRGAYNMMSRLEGRERMCGVVAYSSGNHAQAVALAGQMLGIQTLIIMPDNAPGVKRRAVEGYGGQVLTYDPAVMERERIAEMLVSEKGLTLVPPYDHQLIIAGQATVAREMHDQMPGLEVLLVPCGGGGLLAGSLISTYEANRSCQVYGVEPELADDARQSVASGQLVRIKNPPTIADGLRTPSLGQLTFPVISKMAAGVITVSEGAIIRAMYLIWTRMKMLVEPSAAVGLAALLDDPDRRFAGKKTGVILSGGNVDPVAAADLFRQEGLA